MDGGVVYADKGIAWRSRTGTGECSRRLSKSFLGSVDDLSIVLCWALADRLTLCGQRTRIVEAR